MHIGINFVGTYVIFNNNPFRNNYLHMCESENFKSYSCYSYEVFNYNFASDSKNLYDYNILKRNK